MSVWCLWWCSLAHAHVRWERKVWKFDTRMQFGGLLCNFPSLNELGCNQNSIYGAVHVWLLHHVAENEGKRGNGTIFDILKTAHSLVLRHCNIHLSINDKGRTASPWCWASVKERCRPLVDVREKSVVKNSSRFFFRGKEKKSAQYIIEMCCPKRQNT